MNTQEEFHQFRSVAKQELEKCALGSGWGLLDQVLFVFEPVVQALFVVLSSSFIRKKKRQRNRASKIYQQSMAEIELTLLLQNFTKNMLNKSILRGPTKMVC